MKKVQATAFIIVSLILLLTAGGCSFYVDPEGSMEGYAVPSSGYLNYVANTLAKDEPYSYKAEERLSSFSDVYSFNITEDGTVVVKYSLDSEKYTARSIKYFDSSTGETREICAASKREEITVHSGDSFSITFSSPYAIKENIIKAPARYSLYLYLY